MVSFFRFVLLAFLCSCTLGESDPALGLSGFYQIQGVGYLFTADSGQYHRRDFNRNDSSLCQVSFEITGIKRVGNELTLQIERPKGCSGMYELIWDGNWQESSPRRIQIYLTSLFNTCSVGPETEMDILKIDLAKALQETPVDLFTIYLREYCSYRDFNCVGNCNLSI